MDDSLHVRERWWPSPVKWSDQHLFSGTAHSFVWLSTIYVIQIQLFQCHLSLPILPALVGVASFQISRPPCKWLHQGCLQGVILLWSVETSQVLTCHQDLQLQVTVVTLVYLQTAKQFTVSTITIDNIISALIRHPCYRCVNKLGCSSVYLLITWRSSWYGNNVECTCLGGFV